ncbi:MAG TPA: hypothetical protein VF139_12215 [Candidatus Polarisedimenticolaceae bacterium]
MAILASVGLSMSTSARDTEPLSTEPSVPEIESIVVLNGPYVAPSASPANRKGNIAEMRFVASMLLYRCTDVRASPELQGRSIEWSAMFGGSFRAPAGLGLMRFDGGTIVKCARAEDCALPAGPSAAAGGGGKNPAGSTLQATTDADDEPRPLHLKNPVPGVLIAATSPEAMATGEKLVAWLAHRRIPPQGGSCGPSSEASVIAWGLRRVPKTPQAPRKGMGPVPESFDGATGFLVREDLATTVWVAPGPDTDSEEVLAAIRGLTDLTVGKVPSTAASVSCVSLREKRDLGTLSFVLWSLMGFGFAV